MPGSCVRALNPSFGLQEAYLLDYLLAVLQVDHPSAVEAVVLSGSGTRAAVQTAGSAVGLLHTADQSYNTLLRSHTGNIAAMAMHPSG